MTRATDGTGATGGTGMTGDAADVTRATGMTGDATDATGDATGMTGMTGAGREVSLTIFPVKLSLRAVCVRPHHIGRLSPELDLAFKSAFPVIGLVRPWGLLRPPTCWG